MEKKTDFFNNEDTYYLNSNTLEKDIIFVENNKIDNISINKYYNYEINNIKLISNKLNNIKKFHIEIKNIDLTELIYFKNLQFISLIDEIKNVDFSTLTELKTLFFTFEKSFIGLDKLNNLENLIVSKPVNNFYNIIRLYYNLKSIELIQPKDFELNKIITKNSRLNRIIIFNSKAEINLRDLEPIKNQIKEFRITNCKNVIGYDFLSELLNLEILVISNCNQVPSPLFARNLINLKQITVIGSSFFEDGNLSGLMRLGLTVGIDNKKHYNINSNEFINYFDNPPTPMP